MKKESLITNDMINLVKDSLPNMAIEEVSFDRCRAFSVGRATISKDPDGSVHMYLDETFDSDYRNVWKEDVGEVLRKEMSRKEPELYIFTDPKFKVLVKKIRDEEIESLSERNLVHFMLGDNSYTIIRIVKPDSLFSCRDTSNDYEIEQKFESYIVEVEPEEEEDEGQKSTELF